MAIAVVNYDAVDLLTRQVLDCACQALDEVAERDEDYPGCPCRVCVHAGQPADDNCCPDCGPDDPVGGQLHVWVERIYPSTTFPQQDNEVRGFRNCPPPAGTAVDLVVALMRCAPTIDELGNPPSCEALDATARIVNIDAWVLHRSVACCLPEIELPGQSNRRGRKHIMRNTHPVGPRGGCVGVEVRATVDLGATCACPRPDPS